MSRQWNKSCLSMIESCILKENSARDIIAHPIAVSSLPNTKGRAADLALRDKFQNKAAGIREIRHHLAGHQQCAVLFFEDCCQLKYVNQAKKWSRFKDSWRPSIKKISRAPGLQCQLKEQTI